MADKTPPIAKPDDHPKAPPPPTVHSANGTPPPPSSNINLKAKSHPTASRWTQAPVNVSPLIKLCRWSMLIAGIVYGATKHRQYSKEEAEFRKKEAIKKKERDAVLAEQKKIAKEREERAFALLSQSTAKE